MRITFHAIALAIAGCGVEAGNPDSKKDKLLRVFVAPASYPNTKTVTATIKTLNINDGTSVKSEEFTERKMELLSNNAESSLDSTLTLSINRDEVSSIGQLEFILAPESPYLELELTSQEEPVYAAVIDENGQLKNSLIFNSQIGSNEIRDILVDVELRKSLKTLTETQRVQLQLPREVQFVIQQKHSFMDNTQAGSVAFTNLTPGTIVCVFSGTTLPAANNDSCTGENYKSQIVNTSGSATIGSLKPGNYRTANITADNTVVELEAVTVRAGEKTTTGLKE